MVALYGRSNGCLIWKVKWLPYMEGQMVALYGRSNGCLIWKVQWLPYMEGLEMSDEAINEY